LEELWDVSGDVILAGEELKKRFRDIVHV